MRTARLGNNIYQVTSKSKELKKTHIVNKNQWA